MSNLCARGYDFCVYIYTDILRFFVRVFGFTLFKIVQGPYGHRTETIRKLCGACTVSPGPYGKRMEPVWRPYCDRVDIVRSFRLTILSKCGVKSPFRLFIDHNSCRCAVLSGRTITRTSIECYFYIFWPFGTVGCDIYL